MKYNFIIEYGNLSHFFLVNKKNRSPKGLIPDDRHDNIHLSPSSNEIMITNKTKQNTTTHPDIKVV